MKYRDRFAGVWDYWSPHQPSEFLSRLDVKIEKLKRNLDMCMRLNEKRESLRTLYKLEALEEFREEVRDAATK